MSKTLNVDVYWSFRSPYSYLVTHRLIELEKAYNLEFQIRPVYPLILREKGFFKRANPLFLPYLIRDVARTAEMLDIAFGLPRPDPIVIDPETGDAAEEQPYIHRLTRLGVAASDKGRGLAFAHEVGGIIWSGKVDGWNEGAHLAEATARAGIDLAALEAEVEARREGIDDAIERNQEELQKAGHWGVPTMVFEDEPFFGQDRVDVLLWRLKQHGLEKVA